MDLERIRLLLQRPRRLRQVIGVVGQPRSGTTLLAAMLGMHSRINAVFEPWNLKHAQTGNGCRITLDDFIISLDVKFSAQQDVLLLKETTTELAYVNGLASLLSSLTGPVRPGLIVIIRNPFHVYLSEIEARRKWWGANGLTISSETFDRWASRTLDALGALRSLAERFDGVVITYEKLTRSPKSVGKLLGFFGLSLEAKQVCFERHVGRLAVAGDPGLLKNPRPVSDSSVARRTLEFEEIREIINGSRYFGAMVELARWTDGLRDAEPRPGLFTGMPVDARPMSPVGSR